MKVDCNWKWDYIKYFKEEEFYSSDTNEEEMELDFMIHLDGARERAGVPFIINSGYRTESHNKAVGGSKNSYHMKGIACDISTNNENRYEILFALIEVGFKTIIIYENFVHVDLRKNSLGCRIAF